MRFALLSAFPPYRGGISQFGASLVRELRQEHTVAAFTFTRQYPGLLFPGTSQYDPDAKDEVQAVRVLDTINPLSWGRTADWMLDATPDVAVLRYWMPFFAPAMGMVAKRLRRRGTKVLSIVDNAMPHEPHFYDKPLTKWFFNNNDGLVAMTEAVRKDILSIRPDARTSLLPHPLYDHFGAAIPQAEARARLGLPADAKVLLFFGLIRDYKGLDLLIESCKGLDRRYHLVVAGEPYGDFGKYRHMLEGHPLQGNIHVHDRFIGDDEVPAFFSAADAVVLPYRSATQSGITAIAYHFGLPVVATDVGGLKEAVQHGQTGVVVPTATAEAILAGIRELFAMDLQELRDHVEAMRRKLSWQGFAEGLVAFAKTL